jgi:chromosome segregation ATPase
MFERELATAVNTKMDELKSKLEVDAKRREDELRREVNHQLDALRTERAELERERKKLHAELEKKLVQAKLEREARGQIERELMAIEEDIERLRAEQQELEDAIRNRVLRPKVIIEK